MRGVCGIAAVGIVRRRDSRIIRCRGVFSQTGTFVFIQVFITVKVLLIDIRIDFVVIQGHVFFNKGRWLLANNYADACLSIKIILGSNGDGIDGVFFSVFYQRNLTGVPAFSPHGFAG